MAGVNTKNMPEGKNKKATALLQTSLTSNHFFFNQQHRYSQTQLCTRQGGIQKNNLIKHFSQGAYSAKEVHPSLSLVNNSVTNYK